jgi:HlyD family type I secretion membrane fusion protein
MPENPHFQAFASRPFVATTIGWTATAASLAVQLFLPRKGEAPEAAVAFADPRRLVAKGRLVTVLFLFGFLLWAAFAQLQSALIAPGVVVVQGHRKVLQHLEGGVVQAILVREGQEVAAGQPLIELDATQAGSSLDAVQGEVDALTAQEARLLSESRGSARIAFPQALTARSADPKVRQAIAGETAAFEARRAALDKQIEILRQRKSEGNRAMNSLEMQLKSAQERSRLLAREAESVEELYAKQLVNLPRLLQLQREAAAAAGERDSLVERIEQARLQANSNDLQITGLRNQQMSDLSRDLRDAQTRRFDALERLRAAKAVQGRTNLVAPVAGVVVGLAVHTKGAVIRPGDTMLEIVPKNDELLVEAHINPEDADNVRSGLTARVNFTGYEQRIFPTLTGVVQLVSADRLTDAKSGMPYFAATIAVDRTMLKNYEAKFIPGLPVEVAIETGARTFLQYLTRPITDVIWRGMREK